MAIKRDELLTKKEEIIAKAKEIEKGQKDDVLPDIIPGVSFSSNSTVDSVCKLHFIGLI